MTQKETFSIRKFNTGTHSARLGTKAIALVGALTLATSGTIVKAEESISGPTNTSVETTETQKEVTQAEVEAAKTAAGQATEAVKMQSEVVKSTEKSVEGATKEVMTAETVLTEAQELSSKATPEGIEEAEGAISSAEKEVTDAVLALTKAKEAEAAEITAVETKETQVLASQQAVTDKSVEVVQAQTDLDQAQAILDGTGQVQIIKDAEDKATIFEQDKKNLAQAEDDLQKAKEADADRQLKINDSQTKAQDAQKELEKQTQIASDAETTANNTAKELKVAQSAFTFAENDLKAINTISLTEEYVAALRNYALNYSEKGTEAKALLDAMATSLRSQNTFKVNANDESITLETNNLSEDVLTELSLFTSDLINQIRQAFGTKATSVTKDAIRLADLTSDGYVTDNWSFADTRTIGHDAKAVNAAAKELGLKTTSAEDEAQGFQNYENMNTFSNPSATITLANAKRKIYQSLISFMFNGYEYLHAESIAGLTSDAHYLGVDLSSRETANSVHFLLVADSDLTPGSNFDKAAIKNDKTADKIQAIYTSAETKLAQATQSDKAAQETLGLKRLDKQLAESEVQAAQEELAKTQAVAIQTPSAEQAVTLAKAKVQASGEANQKAQEALKSLEADVKVKQSNVEAAKSVLETKEAELKALKLAQKADEQALEEAKTAKNKATADVMKAEKTLADAKATLLSAEKYLKDLENAPAKLKEAQLALSLAVTRLEDKKLILADEITRLEALRKSEKDATKHYQELLAAYQEVLEAKHQAKLAKEYEVLIKAGQTPVAVTDKTGKVTGYVAQVKNTPVATKDRAVTTVQKAAALPNTGTNESGLGLVGFIMTLFTLLGIAHQSKKRTN